MNDINGPGHDRLFAIASAQAGYFTTAQARDCGFSRPLLTHHVKHGKFKRFRTGLYRFREYPSSPREEVIAAWLAVGRDVAVVSHESALDVLGLADVVPDHIHLTVPRTHRGRKPPSGVKLHTAVHPPEDEDVVTRHGMRVTAPARSIIDSIRAGIAPEQAVMAVRQALERGMTTRAALRDHAVREGGAVANLITRALSEAG